MSASPRSPISFGVLKAILKCYGLTPDTHPDELSQSLRLVYPLNTRLAAKVRAASTSLTDAATSNEQIRFFQRQRARRSYVRIAEHIAREFGSVVIRVTAAQELDVPSREFLEVAVRVCGWSVQLCFDSDTNAHHHVPSPEEQRLLDMLSAFSLVEHAGRISSLAFDYVNSGDAWTAISLGRVLQNVEHSPRVWNLLAIAHAMVDETVQAEFYYDRWGASGLTVDAIRAIYGKAMLYARHHPAGLRDLNRSADLLNQAYALIQQLIPDERGEDAVIFDEVFNRNGFALILFRRGNVEEAVRLLRWGIETLTDTGEKVAIHRTVLIYNLAQCFKQEGNLEAAIATYRELLEVDPHMPEYHLEAAKCLAAAGDIGSALAACRAAISLDDTLASAWALLGVYEGENSSHGAAAQAHARAASLDPGTCTHATNLVYSLILAERIEEAVNYIDGWIDSTLPREEAERRASLSAEIFLRQDRYPDALEPIDAALALFPDSRVLNANREAILSMTA
ncbi:tetratricopeptide repeat protein [Arthrobacter sp. MA-N2]|uniref:tetratricopeptide repeat protein n=1 Tax=Arthrobacter sp. MA-N2 TaxID=1101188 RepID=UPI0004881EB8|nr:tetratricopeptide repeat protein [Arthrobacter sp. MA-N2]